MYNLAALGKRTGLANVINRLWEIAIPWLLPEEQKLIDKSGRRR
jgi:hypothetical protein